MKCQAPKRLSMFTSPAGWALALRQFGNREPFLAR